MTLLIFLESMLVVGTGVILTMLLFDFILPAIALIWSPPAALPHMHWNQTTMMMVNDTTDTAANIGVITLK